MVRIGFYVILILVSFTLLMYSLYQREFIIDPNQPGYIRLIVQFLVFLGIIVAFISVVKAYRDKSNDTYD